MTLSYVSDYPYTKGYYLMDGQNVSLICQINVSYHKLTWTAGGTAIYTYYNGNGAKASTIYKDRILDYQVTEKEHQLDLLVSKSVDEGQRFTCQVRISALVFETGEIHLKQIMGE